VTDYTGQYIDDYHLIRLLGTGTFGEVYLGEHLSDQTQVAVKMFSLHRGNLKTFVKEVSLVFRLEHPSIIHLQAFGISPDDIPYLIMDYAPNGTLRQRHPKGTRLPLNTIISYLHPLAEALQYAHDKRVIHRDVKPENVLIGQDGEVLLSDFGVAVTAPLERSLSTQSLAGTVPYIAPEQIRGKPQAASDQYALGIMAYEWLCGTRPFQGAEWEILDQHQSCQPPSLCEKLPDLSPMVEEVILKALAKEPQERFARIKDFVIALQQCSTTLASPPCEQQAQISITLDPHSIHSSSLPHDTKLLHATQEDNRDTLLERENAVSSRKVLNDDQNTLLISQEASSADNQQPQSTSNGYKTVKNEVHDLSTQVPNFSQDQHEKPLPQSTSDGYRTPSHQTDDIANQATLRPQNPLSNSGAQEPAKRKSRLRGNKKLLLVILLLLVTSGGVLSLPLSSARCGSVNPRSKTPSVEKSTATPLIANTSTLTPQNTRLISVKASPTALISTPEITVVPLTPHPSSPSPQQSSPQQSSPPVTPTPATSSAPLARISFEDGQTDYMSSSGNPITLQASTDYAHDGTHSLKLTYANSEQSTYPEIFIEASHMPSPYPQSGQTLTAWIYIPSNSSLALQAKLFELHQGSWSDVSYVSLPKGQWYELTYKNIPTSNPDKIGIQFGGTGNGVIYVDAINW
jgi:serine/threonine protein kinase